MSSVDDKLRRGFDVLARAEGDRDLLGVALLALHGALEDHLDEALRQTAELRAEEHDLLGAADYGWRSRVALAQRHGLISAEQGQAMLSANEQRRQFAHGAALRWGAREVENYSDLAARICGRRATAAHTARVASATYAAETSVEEAAPRARPPRTEPAGAARRIRTSEGAAVGSSRWESRPAAQRRRPNGAAPAAGGVIPAGLLPDSLPVRIAIGVVAVLVLLLAASRLLAPPEEEALTPVSEPQAAIATEAPLVPTAPPTPTPRLGRIVNLGGAVGWLREQPSFTAATLPVPLSDNTQVTIIDREPVVAEGTTWGLVATGGYEGWAPLNNIAEDAPATPAPADAPTATPAQ